MSNISQNKKAELVAMFKYLRNIKPEKIEDLTPEEATEFFDIKNQLMQSISDLLNFDSRVTGCYPVESYDFNTNTKTTVYKPFFDDVFTPSTKVKI